MNALVLGFDTEADPAECRPYEAPALKSSLDSLVAIDEHLRVFGAPATFFLVGKLVEAAPGEFRQLLAGSRYEIASHTYSHIIFKAFLDRPVTPVPALAEVESDVAHSLTVLKKTFGLQGVHGLCVPGNYYQGLQNRPDLQTMLIRQGLKYVCSDGRGPVDTIPAPFTQPYWYSEGNLLEIPHTGWHCNVLNSLMGCTTFWPPLPSTQLPAKKVETIDEQIEVYRREFTYAFDHDLFYAPCLHPWSLYRFDPQMRALRSLLQWARDKQVPVRTYGQINKSYYSLAAVGAS